MAKSRQAVKGAIGPVFMTMGHSAANRSSPRVVLKRRSCSSGLDQGESLDGVAGLGGVLAGASRCLQAVVEKVVMNRGLGLM